MQILPKRFVLNGNTKGFLSIDSKIIITFRLTNNLAIITGKNNRFPFLVILGYLKFGGVRQVPIRELGWEFPGWDLSHFAKFGIFMGIL